jgi:hypothetical protein
MRIWHQSFTVLKNLGAYDDALRAHFRRVARPDTEIVMHGMHAGTYRSSYPGEAPMCVLLASQRLSEVDGVPVMDSLSAWVKCAELQVDLARQSGVRVSRRGYWQEPPKADRLREVAAFYGLDKLP